MTVYTDIVHFIMEPVLSPQHSALMRPRYQASRARIAAPGANMGLRCNGMFNPEVRFAVLTLEFQRIDWSG